MMPIAILFAAAFTALVSLSLGRILVRRLNVSLYREEEIPIALVTGSAILSLAVFLLCAVHQFRRGIAIALGLAAIVWAWRSGAFQRSSRTLNPLGCAPTLLFYALSLPFAVLYLVHALAPEASPDGASYHLGMVSRYAMERGFVTLRSNMYAYLTQGVEMLFLHSFVFGRHSAAALTHLSFLFTLASLILCYGRRIGHPTAGAAAALFVFASPVVGIDAASAYIDVATATIVFAVFYLLEVWDADRNTNTLWVAGLIGGFAFAAKYTAALIIPYAVVFVLWRSRKLKPALITAAASLALTVPWIARNIVVAGNPFAPFFNEYFPNSHIHIAFEREYAQYFRTYDVADLGERIYQTTIAGFKLTGLVGPLFLLLPIGLLALRLREGRRIWAVGLVALAAYPLNVGTRFLIPGLPYLALAIALGVAAIPFRTVVLAALMVAHASASWPFPPLGTMNRFVDISAWRINRFPWKAALRRESEHDYLSRTSQAYRHARFLEEKVPPGKRILSAVGVMDAYTSREVLVWFQSAENESLRDILFAGFDSAMQPRHIWRFNFPSIETRKIRVHQTADAPRQQWSVTEVRLYKDNQEWPRGNSWRLTAKPFPWDVPLAFDNSAVTRWRSWQPAVPGMYIEVDLGTRQPLTQVHVETSHDSSDCRMELQTWDGTQWTRIETSPELLERHPTAWMRRMAAEELRLRGVDYLLLTIDDWGGKDILNSKEEWGMTHIGEEGGARLYRLEPLPQPAPPPKQEGK